MRRPAAGWWLWKGEAGSGRPRDGGCGECGLCRMTVMCGNMSSAGRPKDGRTQGEGSRILGAA